MMLNPVPSLTVSMDLLMSGSQWDSEVTEPSVVQQRSVKSKVPDPSRWCVLLSYCTASFLQTVIWNTWSPIATSVLFAYPQWAPSTVALLSNWGCITFMIFIMPSCWILNKQGLKTSVLAATVLSTLGSGVRCITNERYFQIFAHFGAILNGMGGVALGPAIVVLSSTWFPSNQRTSATGMGTASSLLGMAGSYLIGPMTVSEPPPENLSNMHKEMNKEKIRLEISHMLYICFLCELILLVAIILFFPDEPSLPPSKSSVVSLTMRPKFKTSLAKLVKNRDIWLLSIAAALCSGITGPWLSLLTITFSHSGVSQSETARLGFWTVICSCFLGLSVTKVSDYCQGHLRVILILFVGFADVMFLLILLLTSGTIPFTKDHLIIAVVCGLATVWSTPALFYELGAELAYPVPGSIVAGSMMSLTNVTACIVYLQLYIFPKNDATWMNQALFLFGLLSVTTLCFVHEKYNRLRIDLA